MEENKKKENEVIDQDKTISQDNEEIDLEDLETVSGGYRFPQPSKKPKF